MWGGVGARAPAAAARSRPQSSPAAAAARCSASSAAAACPRTCSLRACAAGGRGRAFRAASSHHQLPLLAASCPPPPTRHHPAVGHGGSAAGLGPWSLSTPLPVEHLRPPKRVPALPGGLLELAGGREGGGGWLCRLSLAAFEPTLRQGVLRVLPAHSAPWRAPRRQQCSQSPPALVSPRAPPCWARGRQPCSGCCHVWPAPRSARSACEPARKHLRHAQQEQCNHP